MPCKVAWAAFLSLVLCGHAGANPKCDKGSDTVAVAATSLAFGTYSPGSASPTDSNSTITVSCTNQNDALPSFTVALSAGNAGGFSPRHMLSGSNALNYNMFTDAGYSIVWGDGTSGTSVQSFSSDQHTPQVTYTDYGQLFPSQFVTAGSYADTIIVTVSF